MTIRPIDFTLDIENGKYTVRVFNDGGTPTMDFLRYGEPWISGLADVAGAKMWIAVVFELYALRTGQGSTLGTLPHEVAKEIIADTSLPKSLDGVTPLPVPGNRLESLLARAITVDRARGPIDAAAIAELVLKETAIVDPDIRRVIKSLIVAALTTAQARGARISTITEDDYAEASRAAHETFMSVLKDKGFGR